VFEFLENLLHTFFAERILVASLRSRQDEEIAVLAMLVLDQRLSERCFAVEDVDQVIDHTALAAHDQVQVAQADVKIDDGSFVTTQGEARCEAGAGGGLADPTLAGRYDDNTCHRSFPAGRKTRFYPQNGSSAELPDA
jgi:hypothetical protein